MLSGPEVTYLYYHDLMLSSQNSHRWPLRLHCGGSCASRCPVWHSQPGPSPFLYTSHYPCGWVLFLPQSKPWSLLGQDPWNRVLQMWGWPAKYLTDFNIFQPNSSLDLNVKISIRMYWKITCYDWKHLTFFIHELHRQPYRINCL